MSGSSYERDDLADLDVSDVLLDPDFASDFQLVRQTEVPAGKGRADFVDGEPIDLVGVVLSATYRDVVRVPDLERAGGGIVVHVTGFEIVDSDIVLWRGDRYTVLQVDDLTNFGAEGFTRATCKRETLP